MTAPDHASEPIRTLALQGASIHDDRAFRAGIEALGFEPDIPRNPRKTGASKNRGFVPDRWVVERTHAHLGVFRGIRTRWSRKLDSFEAFLAVAAGRYIIRAMGL